MHKRLSLFIICLLLVSSLLTALHHHDVAGGDHHDCPICAVSNHQAADCGQTFAFAPGTPSSRTSTQLQAVSSPVTSPCYSPANNRAPPA